MAIAGTEHQHFADWLGWIYSPTSSGRRAARVIDRCTISFFNKYLKGMDDHLLDDPRPECAEILRFMKK